MNAATVSRTLSLIPERVARTQSGSLFDPSAQPTCAHPERITHLAQFLSWLGPLNPATKEDLRVFGLITAYGKPAIASDMDDDEVDADAELDLEDAELEHEVALEATQPPVSAEVQPALP
ncbi:MAG TPA: hypothetical protein VM183_00340 [Burkholderiales bacterium]|nr:hypothetical protein [Burkholderiales bacterium]